MFRRLNRLAVNTGIATILVIAMMFLTSCKDVTSSVVTAEELRALVYQQKVKIFDLRSTTDFEAGHIPGAININNKEFEDPNNAIDGEIATPAQFAALMSAYGISAGDRVIMYAAAAKPQMAPRLWWTLEVYGHHRKQVLDGHYEAWVAAGYEVETGPAAEPAASEYEISHLNLDILATRDDCLNPSADTVLLDVRPVDQYTGEDGSDVNARWGHIPGAVNVYYLDAVDENGFFKDVESLTALYAAAGVTSDKEIITYCQRGHRGSYTWFVLTNILGFRNVRLYDGSMIEWSNLPAEDYPMTTGTTP